MNPADSAGRDVPFTSTNYSSLPNGTQAIIASYKFQCQGEITAWNFYFEPGENISEDVYTIHFQVWRPSPTVETNGCYGLVGQNVFHNIALSNAGTIQKTPESSEIITALPGDVVGYYAVSETSERMSILQMNANYTEETVWYHTNTDEDPLVTSGPPELCLFTVGSDSDRILSSMTKVAPVLSLNMSKFCKEAPP